MIKCKACAESGIEEKFEIWEDGVPTLTCYKCGSEEFENVPEEETIDPLASWYKGTAVILRPSQEEKNGQTS